MENDMNGGMNSFGLGEDHQITPVNENEEFCCLFRTRLGSHSIVYGAEMDGYRLRTPAEQGRVETSIQEFAWVTNMG